MVNVLELVLPIISGALLLGYHLFWIVELIKFPNRTTLSLVLRVKKAWVKTTVSYLPQNNVFVVQALRNGIFASNFFAFTSSAISFVLLNLSTTSSGLLKFQFLAAAGFLALTFINMGIVIRNHNNAGYLITVGRDIEVIKFGFCRRRWRTFRDSSRQGCSASAARSSSLERRYHTHILRPSFSLTHSIHGSVANLFS